jgi:hypothetical protein
LIYNQLSLFYTHFNAKGITNPISNTMHFNFRSLQVQLPLLFLLILPPATQARLGETSKECLLRYGAPPKIVWNNELTAEYPAIEFVSFRKDPFEVIRIAFRDDRAVFVQYVQSQPMLPSAIIKLLESNSELLGEPNADKNDFEPASYSDNSNKAPVEVFASLFEDKSTTQKDEKRAVGTKQWKTSKGFICFYQCFGSKASLIIKYPDFDKYVKALEKKQAEDSASELKRSQQSEINKLQGF